jgi:hypothetical protein
MHRDPPAGSGEGEGDFATEPFSGTSDQHGALAR